MMRAILPILIVPTLLAAGCSPRVSEEEIAQRVAASDVRWNSYMEDLKAQIGAAPVAEWDGKPVGATRENGTVTVVFAVRGPWARRNAAIPVLMRDPLGNTYEGVEARATSGGAAYAFQVGERWNPSGVPWVELQYPHHEFRVVFRQDGTWNAKGEN